MGAPGRCTCCWRHDFRRRQSPLRSSISSRSTAVSVAAAGEAEVKDHGRRFRDPRLQLAHGQAQAAPLLLHASGDTQRRLLRIGRRGVLFALAHRPGGGRAPLPPQRAARVDVERGGALIEERIGAVDGEDAAAAVEDGKVTCQHPPPAARRRPGAASSALNTTLRAAESTKPRSGGP